MLECLGLSVNYGQHQALGDVAIRINPGEIVVILGANGAGKSTLLNAIAGLIPSSSGQIMVDGRSVTGKPSHAIVEAGLALVPEDRRLFGELTVEENLRLGAFAQRARDSETAHLDKVLSLFPRLDERKKQLAHTMSGGEQQMVAIGRAMMSAPTILMLDEPSLGLSPLLTSELFKTLEHIRETGVGILLVEQNAHQGLAIADRGYLLENGRIVGEDRAEELARNPAIQEAYLGGAGEQSANVPPPSPAQSPVGEVDSMGTRPISVSSTATKGSGGEASRADGPMAIAQAALARFDAASRTPETQGGPDTDTLAKGSISEMVRRAAELQSGHIRSREPASSERGPRPFPAGVNGPSLPPQTSSSSAGGMKGKFVGAPTAGNRGPVGIAPGHETILDNRSFTGNSLADAITRIEQAAAAARRPRRNSMGEGGPGRG